ncbi:MAG: helix-turn-helix domain-containing protein [Candidatus Melainabacteria bacterium]|jgi:excisionase family DNA binding protein
MNQNSNFLTTQDASKMLYLTEYTVRKYIRKGLIKAIKLNKHYLINKSEIDRILQTFSIEDKKEEKQSINV